MILNFSQNHRMGTGEDDDDVVNLAFVESLLSASADMNYPDVYGQSIFFGVVRDWHVDVARFAIERGANVNHKDRYGRTPLHLAAAVNYAEMVSFIIDSGGKNTICFSSNSHVKPLFIEN